MPIKRRAGKSRFVAPWGAIFTETELWSCVFVIGFDALGTLHLIGGVPTQDMQPPLELTQDAWSRLGREWLAARDDDEREAWAEKQFGRPWESPAGGI